MLFVLLISSHIISRQFVRHMLLYVNTIKIVIFLLGYNFFRLRLEFVLFIYVCIHNVYISIFFISVIMYMAEIKYSHLY